MNQIIARFPGVAQDSAANGDLHVRGEHANLQYRIDDVLLPEGIAGFGLELDPRFIQSIKLITGSLPAQYGFRTAGVVDIQTKSGALNPGGEVSLYGGSYDTFNPSFEYGGRDGKFNYFVDGSYNTTASASRIRRAAPPPFMIIPNNGRPSSTALILLTTPAESPPWPARPTLNMRCPTRPAFPPGPTPTA